MVTPGDFVEYRIQNKDTARKLLEIEDEIADELRAGRRVMVLNESDYAVAATTVVETVKSRLRDAGTKVYQANQLKYEPVLVSENPNQPFAKRKTHHYKISLAVLMSSTPITEINGATLQETPSIAKSKVSEHPVLCQFRESSSSVTLGSNIGNWHMARVYGFLGGVVVTLSTVYASVLLVRSNTAAIHRELRHADDLARDRPRLVRPYTDPIDLKTQSFKDTFADLWNGEIIKGVNYLYSLKSK